MKYFVGICSLLILNKLSAQKAECYCYENDVNKYTEWLYFMNDSVIVVGQMDKSCQDLNIDNMLEWAHSRNYVRPIKIDKDKIKFTKILTNPHGLIDEIQYSYIALKGEKGMEVHIEYTHNFKDSMGPPDRFYKQIELKE